MSTVLPDKFLTKMSAADRAKSKRPKWNRAMTLHAIGTYDDDVIAELFRIGHDLQMAIKKKRNPVKE